MAGLGDLGPALEALAARGVFFGMDGGTNGLNLMQATVEGMAFTLGDAVAALETADPVPEMLAASVAAATVASSWR